MCLHFLLNSPYWFLLCPCTQNAFVQLTGGICGAKTNGQGLGPHFTFYLTYFPSLTHFLPGCSTLLTFFLTLCSTLSGPLLVALFFIILSCWSFQEMIYFLEPQNSFLWPFFYLHVYTWTSSLNFCLSSCMSHYYGQNQTLDHLPSSTSHPTSSPPSLILMRSYSCQ